MAIKDTDMPTQMDGSGSERRNESAESIETRAPKYSPRGPEPEQKKYESASKIFL